MLTKDLVQATVRSGRLYPKFIKEDDVQAISEAEEIRTLFSDVTGRIVSDLDDDLKAAASTPRKKGFGKLLLDRCEVIEPGDEVMDLRWDVFERAELLRQKGQLSHLEFVNQISNDLKLSVEDIKSRLFSDLPSARTIQSFEPIESKALVESYNLSHITTCLCLAEDVSITVSKITIAQRRELMRRLKFFRLMSDVEVDRDSQSLTLELSGPLRLFGKAQGYALRIANFFPFIASLPSWKLEALVQWKGKKVELKVDESSGVKTKFSRSHGGYIPKEFEIVLNAMKDIKEFQFSAGEDFIHLGKQSYCFPDFDVTFKSKKFGVELFHAWHKSQLVHRIEAALRAKAQNLIIGVDRSLMKDSEVKKICESNVWFQKFGFEYSQFPTPNVLKKAILQHD